MDISAKTRLDRGSVVRGGAVDYAREAGLGGAVMSEILKLRSDKVERIFFVLEPLADLDSKLREMAEIAKEKWGDRIIAPDTTAVPGVHIEKRIVDGVPIRYTEAFDIRSGEVGRAIDVMGYPPEAVLED